MTFAFFRSLALVSFGALLVGHTLVRWAARKADGDELAPSFAIGFGTVAVGLALQATGGLATAVLLGALALIVAGLLALVRRRSRSLS